MWVGVLAFTAFAEEAVPKKTDGGKNNSTELAKKTQNPIADMISLPFQWNVAFDSGSGNHTSSVLNIQPVIPFHLNDDWNLITRTIMPVTNQPPIGTHDREEWGFGNIFFTAFLSPNTSSKWTWGVGPAFEFPTNSSGISASDNWSMGPSFVALKIDGPWVVGGLINQVWSVTTKDAEVNKMLAQPFVNYNMKDGWYLVSAPIVTADWTADHSNQWTIPVGGGIGKVVHCGKLPVNLSTQFYYNVEKPRTGADWSLRFVMQFLFPK